MSLPFQRATRLEGFAPYQPRQAKTTPRFKIDANEAAAPALPLDQLLGAVTSDTISRYTRTGALEADIAASFGLEPDRVAVTAGADDGLLRLCLMTLEPGRQALLTRPSFEMIPRYVALAGGAPAWVDWFDAPVPTDALVDAVSEQTSIVFLVTPSSPAGESADLATVERLAEACARVNALLVVDHAYVEFSEADFTEAALAFPNVIVARTFSKAWGLAGLRVGYFLGAPEVIAWVKTVGQPYAVATPSVALARAALAAGSSAMHRRVALVRQERARLTETLVSLGAAPVPSEGNFVLARLGPAGAPFAAAMAEVGISVRVFGGPGVLDGAIRITCPGDDVAFDALMRALPDALKKARP